MTVRFLGIVLAAGGLLACNRHYYEPAHPDWAYGHGSRQWVERYRNGRAVTVNGTVVPRDLYVSTASFGPPMPRSSRDAVVATDRSAFNLRAARAAFESADLSSCVAVGAPAGFGHARVTFRPEGHVERIFIDAPAGMSIDAVQCVGTELGRLRVAPFEGHPITIGTTYLVK